MRGLMSWRTQRVVERRGGEEGQEGLWRETSDIKHDISLIKNDGANETRGEKLLN